MLVHSVLKTIAFQKCVFKKEPLTKIVNENSYEKHYENMYKQAQALRPSANNEAMNAVDVINCVRLGQQT